MLDQIGSNQRQALFCTDQPLDGRPFGFLFFLFRCFIVFEDRLDFSIDARFLVLVQFDSCQPALVENGHRRSILDGPADVVDINIFAEDRRRIDIVGFDRRAGKADERCVRHRLADIMRIAIATLPSCPVEFCIKPVLAAMRLICHDDDIAPSGQFGEVLLTCLRRKFLHCGEYHAAGCTIEKLV